LLAPCLFAEFRDASEQLGFSGGGKAAFADYDGDGWVDLYAGKLFRNYGGKKFVPANDSGVVNSRGAVWVDINNDGDLDLSTAGKLFVNEGRTNNWIEVVLIGDGKRVNRSAVGAIVRIRLKDRVLTRHAETGTGEGNQNDLRLHFGLGARREPVSLDIVWPGKVTQRVDGLAVNKLHRIEYKLDSP